MRRLGLATLFALACVLSFPAAARAQTEAIGRYQVAIVVERSGDLDVTERIGYDFGDVAHHGIIREIPVVFRYDQRYDRVEKVDVRSVTATNGASDTYKASGSGGSLEIKIGDPKKTITGFHTYTISYVVHGALNGFADHDELYWNAIGTEWSVPIARPSVQVTLPASVQRVACFAGPFGSNLPCSRSSFHGGVATFSNAGLGPDEGLSVVVGFPKGVVAAPEPILRERWTAARAFSLTPLTGGLAGALLLLVLGAIAWLVWTRGRDVRAEGSAVDVAFAGDADKRVPTRRVPLFERGASPVEYVPPEDIRPGEIGTLVDEQANTLDVTATIVDLAVRGYLRIEEIPKHGLFGKPDWRLVKLRDSDGLIEYERRLFDGIFSHSESDEDDPGSPEAPVQPGLEHVRLSALRLHFASTLSGVEGDLYDDVVSRKWFPARPDQVRQRWSRFALVLLAAGVGLTWLAAAKSHLGLLPIPLAIGGVALLWGSHRMPHRTARGTGMVRRVFGFRRYIETAEATEMAFQEQVNLFSKYLPYAIVFGSVEKWAHAFRGLADQQVQPSWYVGPHPFTTLALVSSIDHFSVTTAGTIAATPGGSGSSGFGGGGFSGGGGGGGGGGSW